jgi:hypothetical protein
MSIGVIFAGSVVGISHGAGVKGSKSFEPLCVVLMEAGLIVIDEHAGCYMHGIDQAQTFLNTGLCDRFCDFACNIDKAETLGVPKG